MKYMKKFFIVLLICLLFVPYLASAEEKTYNTLNLDEALNQEEIEHDFSNYEENDEQAVIYVFRGNGCAYCRKLLTFLNSIIDEYGKYFKVVSYEVWYDSDNASLMDKVSEYLEQPATGVPYVVIGDKVFAGYSETYDEDIKSAIKKLYDTKKEERYDVFEQMEKNPKTEEKASSNFSIVVFNIIVSLALVAGVAVYDSKKRIDLENRISELEKKLNTKNTSKKNNA